MALRYVATNRDWTQLSRVVSTRSERLTLEKGGYYFIDTNQYMGHYSETVQAQTVPPETVVLNSEHSIFHAFLNHSAIGAVTILVHGFNMDLPKTITWFDMLTESLKATAQGTLFVSNPQNLEDQAKIRQAAPGSLTALIGFSWPSNGNIFSYVQDQKDALASTDALSSLICRLRNNEKAVHLIAHSMGNYLVCAMLQQVLAGKATGLVPEQQARIERREYSTTKPEQERYLLDHYVMLAADIERRSVVKVLHTLETPGTVLEKIQFLGPYYSGLQHLVGKVHHVYARTDRALHYSNLEKVKDKSNSELKSMLDKLTFSQIEALATDPQARWEMRLGLVPQPQNAPPNMVSYNAVSLANRPIDHSDYVDCLPILEKVLQQLSGGLP